MQKEWKLRYFGNVTLHCSRWYIFAILESHILYIMNIHTTILSNRCNLFHWRLGCVLIHVDILHELYRWKITRFSCYHRLHCPHFHQHRCTLFSLTIHQSDRPFIRNFLWSSSPSSSIWRLRELKYGPYMRKLKDSSSFLIYCRLSATLQSIFCSRLFLRLRVKYRTTLSSSSTISSLSQIQFPEDPNSTSSGSTPAEFWVTETATEA